MANPKRIEALLQQLREDNEALAAAVEALEAEIVTERAKALEAVAKADRLADLLRCAEAQRDDYEKGLEELNAELRDKTREAEAECAKVDALEDQVRDLEEQIEALTAEDNTADVEDALSDFLVYHGYPSRPIKVDCPRLQALVDHILQ